MARAEADTRLDASPELAAQPTCRNCGGTVHGAYCADCGQETTIALPTARQFLREAAGRYVALDGRLWRTLARLTLHPGYLTREYFAGRRRRYVRPSRLFLVLSLVMFAALRLGMELHGMGDGVLRFEDRRSGPAADAGLPRAAADAVPKAADPAGPPRLSIDLDTNASLVAAAFDGPVAQALQRRLDRFNAQSYEEKIEQIALGAMRYGPYAMFVLLPAFALLLQLAYLGRGHAYPMRPRRYAEHLVFAAHSHAFYFLIVTLAALAGFVPAPLLLAWALVYSVWSLKSVYAGRWIGVLARAIVVATAYSVLFMVAVVGLIVAAALLR
jgi:hypothetical protein